MALLQKDGSIVPIPLVPAGPTSANVTLRTSSKKFAPGFKPESLIVPFQEQMDEHRNKIIESAMILCGGNRKKAAHHLQISYRMLNYHLRRIKSASSASEEVS